MTWLKEFQANPKALNRLIREIDRAVARYLRDGPGPGNRRQVEHKRQQAQAAVLRRLRFMTAEDIARHLSDEPLDRTLVYQWVKRGRSVALAALEHWDRTTRSDAVRERIRLLRPLLAANRSDAGKARPWARAKKRSA